MSKATVIRTCIGTGEKLCPANLLRFVAGPDGKVHFDLTGKAPGRGAYIRANQKALAAAIKKKAFKRYLEAEVSNDINEKIYTGLKTLFLNSLGLAKKANQLFIGTDAVANAVKAGRISKIILAIDAAEKTAESLQNLTKNILQVVEKEELSDILGVGNTTVVGVKNQNAVWRNACKLYEFKGKQNHD